ncbi:MAG: Gfo/Idh/MocA family protein [Prochlorothrix sp.]
MSAPPRSRRPRSPRPAPDRAAEPIAVALLGAGRWGRHLLRQFRNTPRAHVVALVDPDSIALQGLAQRVDLEADVALLEEWQQVWQLPQVDAIVVATPPATHAPIVQAALQRRCPVLVESPFTLSARTAYALWSLAQRQRCPLVVNHLYPLHPAVLSGHTALLRQELGPIRYGYSSRTQLGPVRPDVDVLWDLASHDLCIFQQWLGCDPVWVMAQGLGWLTNPSSQQACQQSFQATAGAKPSSSEGPGSPGVQSSSPRSLAAAAPSAAASPPSPAPAAPPFPLRSPPIVDQVWATVLYPPHIPVQFQWSRANPHKQRQSVLVGDRGSLVLDELNPRALVFRQGHLDWDTPEHPGVWSPQEGTVCKLPVADRDPLSEVCEHFLDCVLQNQQSDRLGGREAVKLLMILEALSQSLQQGGQWIQLRRVPAQGSH